MLIALPYVDAYHLTHWGPEQNQNQRKEEVIPACFLPACLCEDISPQFLLWVPDWEQGC